MRSPTRRTLLGVAAGGASGLLAGCISDTTGTATTNDDDTTTTTTTAASDLAALEAFDWREWPPAAGEDSSSERYWTFYADADAVERADLSGVATERIRRLFVALPSEVLAFDETGEFLSFARRSVVCTYDVEMATLRERLEAAAAEGDPTTATATASGDGGSGGGSDDGATDTGTPPTEDDGTAAGTRAAEDTTAAAASAARDFGDAPDGYEAYATPAGYFWLASDHLLFGQRAAALRTIYETGSGDRETVMDATDLGPVVDAVGDVDLFAGRASTQQFVEAATAFGYAWTFGDRVELTAAFAFDAADGVDRERVAALAEEPGFAEYDDASVSVDGRVAALDASIAIDEFDFLKRPEDDDGGETDTPRVSLAYEVDRGDDGEWGGDDDERIAIVHQGGDSVPLERTTVRYDGVDVAESANVDSTPPEGDAWQAGGVWALTVGSTEFAFESGATVQVVWTSDDGERSAVLSQFRLP